jgi:pyrroloquinoline quinone biosynthesis protein D
MSDPVVPEHPTLAPGVRLHMDKTRDAWVLLSPERVIQIEGPASEILQRCDGKRSVDAIIDDLATVYTADRGVIAQDVTDMLKELAAKGLLVK